MNKTDLRNKAGISSATLNKLTRGENVNTSSLLKICKAIDCKAEDIIETIVEGNKENGQ